MDRIFHEWQDQNAAEFGRQPLLLRHRLHQSDLFSDDKLARLIEATPRDRYHVNTTPHDETNPRAWREGDLGGLSGRQVLQSIYHGNIWVHLKRVQETDGAFAGLLDTIFEELHARVPGFKSYKRSMSVLISSPRLNVAYHADVPGQSLWQVRGQKRVWIYPAQAPYLPQTAIEKIVRKTAKDTDLVYQPSYDAGARILDLTPGMMATWPLNCPHRVVNADCVNVSFTTEHWTDELRAHYVVNYANALLRDLVGDRPLARSTSGPGYLARLALAGAHKTLMPEPKQAKRMTIDFRVDPEAPEGFRTIAPVQIGA